MNLAGVVPRLMNKCCETLLVLTSNPDSKVIVASWEPPLPRTIPCCLQGPTATLVGCLSSSGQRHLLQSSTSTRVGTIPIGADADNPISLDNLRCFVLL